MSNEGAYRVLAGTGSLRPGSVSVEFLVTRDEFPPDPWALRTWKLLSSPFWPWLRDSSISLKFAFGKMRMNDPACSFVQTLRTRNYFYFSCLDQLYHALNSLENTRLSPSEQPCQGQPGQGVFRGGRWCLNTWIPGAPPHTSITLPPDVASCLLICHYF